MERVKAYALILAPLVLTIAAGLYWATGDIGKTLHGTGILTLVLAVAIPFVMGAFYLLLGLTVATHELGHYLAARWLGLRVIEVNVVGLELFRKKFQMPPASRLGYVRVESTLEQDRPEVWVGFFAAGPLLGLIVTAIEGALWWISPPAIAPFFGSQVIFGLFLNLNSLFGRGKTTLADGEGIRDVRRPDSQTFAQLALHRMVGFFKGDDPRGFASEDIRRALLVRDLRQRVYATSIWSARAVLDSSADAEVACLAYYEAGKKAESAGGAYAGSDELQFFRQDSTLELAFVLAHALGDAPRAARVMDELNSLNLLCRATALRTEAALAEAMGNRALASEWHREAWSHLAQERVRKPEIPWDSAERFLRLLGPEVRSSESA